MEQIIVAAHGYIHENHKFVLAYNEFIVHRKLTHKKLALSILNYLCAVDWLPCWGLPKQDRAYIIDQVIMMIKDQVAEMLDEDYKHSDSENEGDSDGSGEEMEM